MTGNDVTLHGYPPSTVVNQGPTWTIQKCPRCNGIGGVRHITGDGPTGTSGECDTCGGSGGLLVSPWGSVQRLKVSAMSDQVSMVGHYLRISRQDIGTHHFAIRDRTDEPFDGLIRLHIQAIHSSDAEATRYLDGLMSSDLRAVFKIEQMGDISSLNVDLVGLTKLGRCTWEIIAVCSDGLL